MNSPKYPRTYHLPYSPGATNDDKIASDISAVINCPIVITEKMDGSNTSLEHDGCFARTHAVMPTHPSFDGLKALHASVKYLIDDGVQLFGEWLYALHSIEYNSLPEYFQLFNVRELPHAFGANEAHWLSWEYVETWAEDIKCPTVPVLYKGTVSSGKELKDLIEELTNQPSACGGLREGVVVRIADGFKDDDFSKSVFKWVRANHVQTSEHWKNKEIIKNKLKEK